MKKTAVHFLYGMNCGGLERRVSRTLLALHKFYPDWELHLVVANGDVFYQELMDEKSGVKVHLLHNTGNFDTICKLKKLLTELNPEIVQCWTIKEAAMASLLKPFFHYRLIASHVANVFGKPRNYYRVFHWITGWMADRIVSNSRAGLEAYQVPGKLGVQIPNCYEYHPVPQDRVDGIRREFGLAGKKMVVSVANVQQYKDYDTFLAAAEQVAEQDSNVIFLAVGGGKLLENYRSKVPEKFRKNIIFTGAREDAEAVVEAADIGMLCSFTEGISNTVLEYMAHGKPVIASGGGGLAETILNGKTGYLFPAGDAVSVAAALKELLSDRTKAESMGKAGQKIVQTEYTVEKTARSYMKLYTEGMKQ